MGALYGRHGVLDTVKSGGPNHYFVPEDDVVYKFELGSASHEGCGGLAALGQYFQLIAGTCTAVDIVLPYCSAAPVLVKLVHQGCICSAGLHWREGNGHWRYCLL